jgi:hypothetical protein
VASPSHQQFFADIEACQRNIRFAPKADIAECNDDVNSRGRPVIGRTSVAGHAVMIDRPARPTGLLQKKAW